MKVIGAPPYERGAHLKYIGAHCVRKGEPVKHEVVPLMTTGRFILPLSGLIGALTCQKGRAWEAIESFVLSLSGMVRRLRQKKNKNKKALERWAPSATVKNDADFPHCPLRWLRPCSAARTTCVVVTRRHSNAVAGPHLSNPFHTEARFGFCACICAV